MPLCSNEDHMRVGVDGLCLVGRSRRFPSNCSKAKSGAKFCVPAETRRIAF